MGVKIALLAVLLLAMILPMYAMLKALKADRKLFQWAWAKTPQRTRSIQLLATVVWFVTLFVTFGIAYGITGNVLVAAGSAVGCVIVLAVLGPIVGLGVRNSLARKSGWTGPKDSAHSTVGTR